MVHHCRDLRGSDCDKIIEEVCASLGLDSQKKKYIDMAVSIAGDERSNPEEVLAYAISGCSVGKGNDLAKALYEKYRWKVVI